MIDTVGTERKMCPLCGNPGVAELNRVVDLYFSTPGEWCIRRCGNVACGLWWLDPIPGRGWASESYEGYFTQTPQSIASRGAKEAFEQSILDGSLGYDATGSSVLRSVGRILGWLPPLRDEGARRVMWLEASKMGTLLDVGCGSGGFLARMRGLGWRVQGVEPDPRAAQLARRQFGLDVHAGTLERLEIAPETFDAVTLNHVIEHTADPLALLRECTRILKPGGTLVIVTPNVDSLGQRVFRSRWRGLEAPRHLCLFCPRSMRALVRASDLTVRELRTPARSARWMWAVSRASRKDNDGAEAMGWNVLGWMFQALEQAACAFVPVGEEVLLIATKD